MRRNGWLPSGWAWQCREAVRAGRLSLPFGLRHPDMTGNEHCFIWQTTSSGGDSVMGLAGMNCLRCVANPRLFPEY